MNIKLELLSKAIHELVVQRLDTIGIDAGVRHDFG